MMETVCFNLKKMLAKDESSDECLTKRPLSND